MTTPTGHGGYRRPSNPAPVGMPGALSRRTDGGPGQPVRAPSGGKYGDRQALEQLQQAAPVGASPGGDVATPAAQQLPQVTPFSAPTQQPDVPVTAGAASGPGPGLEALGLGTGMDQDVARLLMYLPVFEMMANVPGSSRATRNFVRQLKGQVTQ